MARQPISLKNGWLTQVKKRPSDNCDARPDSADISLLVIHNISLPPGQFATGCIEDFFCNQLDHHAHPYFDHLRGVEVSAHCLVNREGGITQFVSFDQRAWHAGKSCFDGRERCNDFSIGIELEGTDNSPYTDAQYDSLTRLTRILMAAYPGITLERIAGHSDIAPERKTDPGPAFDWPRFQQALASKL